MQPFYHNKLPWGAVTSCPKIKLLTISFLLLSRKRLNTVNDAVRSETLLQTIH